jgi:hypothetical protein
VTADAAEMVAHGIVSARLDYCNSPLKGITYKNIGRPQVAQNTLASAVCQALWSASATELQRCLHWLPIRQRVVYKTALITYKTRLTRIPSYLAALLQDNRPIRTLRSSDQLLLHEQYYRVA